MTVKDLANRIDVGVGVKDVLAALLTKRLMMTNSSSLDLETATTLSRELGARLAEPLQALERPPFRSDSGTARSARRPTPTRRCAVDAAGGRPTAGSTPPSEVNQQVG
jgi:hypothetical protein